MIDEFVLALQGLFDRIARWARLARTVEAPRRRFLIIQIDGLSKEIVEKALQAGVIPHMARLIASRRFVRRPMSVGLPSSTPAFQAAAMYGVMPDIPGFHYYDKRAQRELHFPEAGAADFVETRHAEGRRGILYLDYDVFAHAFGPAHGAAMRALRRVDIAIGQLVRIIERLPELEYDRYILSDHGQTLSRLFVQVSGGRSLEEVTRSMLGPGAGAIDSRPGHTGKRHLGVARQLARYRRTEARGIVHRFINHGG